ncbi:MAG: M28 family peptidase [Bacteroidetes bacterium]|nr:M28 family peptidase [Bacteroidota bacterium]
MKNKNKIAAILLLTLFVGGICLYSWNQFPNSKSNEVKKGDEKQLANPANFMTDSAYVYIEKQVAFGPRVPGSAAHASCAEWMKSKLSSFGFDVKEQTGTWPNWQGIAQPIRNISASFRPQAKRRILFAAHWDSRPYADKDADFSKQRTPIDGANDGASGVGIILELARMANQLPEGIGMDVLFLDAEDGGKPEWEPAASDDYLTWCLGSQLWAKQTTSRAARYAILLDMVGADGAKFNKEEYSVTNAGGAVDRIWAIAEKIGHGSYFPQQKIQGIVDDHIFMNQVIPTLDIVDMRPGAMGAQNFEFGSSHHTHSDNMSVISKNTLKAVGETLAYTLWNVE